MYNEYMQKNIQLKPAEDIQIDTDIVVIYHAHCYDGFGGAWAAWKKFGESATYIPAKYGQAFPDGLEDKEVYIVDFSYEHGLLPQIEAIARRLVVIDHHASAEPHVTACKEYIFDIDHSGAYLAWQYFHPTEAIPLFIEYLSEADIFKMTLPNAEEIIAYLHMLPQTFASFENMRAEIEDELKREKAVEKGKLLMMYRDKVLEPALGSVNFVCLAGHIIPAVNMCFPISEVSHALHEVYKEHPPISLSYRYNDGEWKCSLRADTEKLKEMGKDYNCFTIAQQFGGGGHPGAAGFSLPFEPGKFPFEITDFPEGI